MTARIYKVRYLVEPWDRPPSEPPKRTTQPGVALSVNDYGYTDEIMVVSILHDKKGEPISIGLFDSESGCGRPSRRLLELVKKQIEHQLAEHCK